MKEERNERITEISRMIETAYLKLTYLNLQYHRIVRDLDNTCKELKRSLSELKINGREDGLSDAYDELYPGVVEMKEISRRMKTFTSTVDGLMDVNDRVEKCLELLDER